MLTEIYDWMKNILLFMAGTTIILNLISKSNYIKYAKFVSGMLLIVFILRPVIRLLDKADQFDFSVDAYESIFSIEEGTNFIDNAEDIKNTSVMTEYKQLLSEQTEKLLYTKGLKLFSLEIEIDENFDSKEFGSIKNMYVQAEYLKEDGEKIVSDIVIDRIIVTIGEEQQADTMINNQENSVLEIAVKNMLADFYNLDVSHINIIIREDNNG